MIFEIRFSNLYSIKDEVCIDFKAGAINTSASRALPDNVFLSGNDTVLKVLGMFGPNASGKTCVVKALSSCTHIVLDSASYNEGTVLPFVPFKFDGYYDKPSSFFIDFAIDCIEYEYSFSMTKESILTEELYYYPLKRRVRVFSRDERKGPGKNSIYSFNPGHFIRPMDVAQSTGRNTLFISRASQMDRELAQKVYNFFRTELIIGMPLLSGRHALEEFEQNRNLILEVLKMADSDISDISVRIEKNTLSDQNPFPVAKEREEIVFYTTHRKNPDILFHLLGEESAGTIQIFNLLLVLLDVCRKGKTLVLDEFDTSLHTSLSQFILDVVNASNNAQFLFSSHNTNLIDIKKLRRDQIVFANKREDGSTEVYSLFDFKDYRENMDAEKCYLEGRFDAIPYVNSSISQIRNLLQAE